MMYEKHADILSDEILKTAGLEKEAFAGALSAAIPKVVSGLRKAMPAIKAGFKSVGPKIGAAFRRAPKVNPVGAAAKTAPIIPQSTALTVKPPATAPLAKMPGASRASGAGAGAAGGGDPGWQPMNFAPPLNTTSNMRKPKRRAGLAGVALLGAGGMAAQGMGGNKGDDDNIASVAGYEAVLSLMEKHAISGKGVAQAAQTAAPKLIPGAKASAPKIVGGGMKSLPKIVKGQTGAGTMASPHPVKVPSVAKVAGEEAIVALMEKNAGIFQNIKRYGGLVTGRTARKSLDEVKGAFKNVRKTSMKVTDSMENKALVDRAYHGVADGKAADEAVKSVKKLKARADRDLNISRSSDARAFMNFDDTIDSHERILKDQKKTRLATAGVAAAGAGIAAGAAAYKNKRAEKAANLLVESLIEKRAAQELMAEAGIIAEASEKALREIGYSMFA